MHQDREEESDRINNTLNDFSSTLAHIMFGKQAQLACPRNETTSLGTCPHTSLSKLRGYADVQSDTESKTRRHRFRDIMITNLRKRINNVVNVVIDSDVQNNNICAVHIAACDADRYLFKIKMLLIRVLNAHEAHRALINNTIIDLSLATCPRTSEREL